MTYEEKYREIQRQRKNANQREYREKNRERVLENERRWWKEHPGYAHERYMKKKAEKKGK